MTHAERQLQILLSTVEEVFEYYEENTSNTSKEV